MNRWISSCVLLFLIAVSMLPRVSLAQAMPAFKTIEIFARQGCGYCAQAQQLAQRIAADEENLLVVVRYIDQNESDRERFRELVEQHQITQAGVPGWYVNEQHFWIGYSEASESQLRSALQGLRVETPDSSEDEVCLPEPEVPCKDSKVSIPFVGAIDPVSIGLPVFTIVLGLVDGFNPCAMWVLLFLLSLLVHLQDRRKMALIAGVFVLVSGVVYFAFMAAWLNFFLLVGLSRYLQIGLGVLACVVGSIHIKDFFFFRKGLSLSISDSAKPGLYAKMRAVVNAETTVAALLAVIVLAFAVNMVELLCTAGLPVLFTNVLAGQSLSTFEYYAYLVLYNIAYMFDDAIMVTIGVVTLSHKKLQENGGRLLKLLSGIAIVVLGTIMLFKPEWL